MASFIFFYFPDLPVSKALHKALFSLAQSRVISLSNHSPQSISAHKDTSTLRGGGRASALIHMRDVYTVAVNSGEAYALCLASGVSPNIKHGPSGQGLFPSS